MIAFLFACFLGFVVAGLITGKYGLVLISLVVMVVFDVFLKQMEQRQALNKKKEEAPPDSVSALEFYNSESSRTHF